MREHQELTPSRVTFREFGDVVRLPTDLGVLTTRDEFVKSLLRKRRRRVVLDDIADGVIREYGSTATRRRSPRRCVRAFAHSSFFCVGSDDDRKFFVDFFDPFFWVVPAFFWWWCSSYGNTCVCMGCFSCKNLLKILQRAADRRRRRRRRRANEQIHAGYFLYEVFDVTEFTRLYSR